MGGIKIDFVSTACLNLYAAFAHYNTFYPFLIFVYNFWRTLLPFPIKNTLPFLSNHQYHFTMTLVDRKWYPNGKSMKIYLSSQASKTNQFQNLPQRKRKVWAKQWVERTTWVKSSITKLTQSDTIALFRQCYGMDHVFLFIIEFFFQLNLFRPQLISLVVTLLVVECTMKYYYIDYFAWKELWFL